MLPDASVSTATTGCSRRVTSRFASSCNASTSSNPKPASRISASAMRVRHGATVCGRKFSAAASNPPMTISAIQPSPSGDTARKCQPLAPAMLPASGIPSSQ